MRTPSRRKLLTAGVAAGVLAASGLSLTAQPRQGGRLRAGIGGAFTSDSWDSRSHMDTFAICMGHGAVFDCLTEVAGDGSLRGELAEGWYASPNAQIWTFDLRKDVHFHDGSPFTADDVIASINLHRLGPSPVQQLLQHVTDIRKLGPYQVQFELAQGHADFPYVMSDYHLVIYPADQLGAGIGTGLYRVAAFEPGVRFLGLRVPDHYKSGQAGWFEQVEFIAMNDAYARTQALLAGEVDVVSGFDLGAEHQIRSNPNLRIGEVTGNRHLTFPMRADVSPFSQSHVRKALKHGIDRTAFVDQVLKGHGRVAADSPIGPAGQFYLADLAPLAYDPDRAQYHLRQAGLDALQLDLAVSPAAFDGAVDAATLYQACAAPCGIDITPRPADADMYWSKTWGQSSFSTAAWSGRATEDWMLSLAYQDGALWNDSAWGADQHPHFQTLLQTARAELDSIKRNALYAEIQTILRDDGSVVIPAFANWMHASRAEISTPEDIGALWHMDNARFAERWWIA